MMDGYHDLMIEKIKSNKQKVSEVILMCCVFLSVCVVIVNVSLSHYLVQLRRRDNESPLLTIASSSN